MITLWVLAMLAIFAVGLGHRSAVNLRLTRYQRDRLRAACLAKAAINRAIVELIQDGNNGNNYDTLSESWANNETIFKKIALSVNQDEYASVGYTVKDDYEQRQVFGLIDEEGKININECAKNDQRFQVLVKLFDFAGVEESESEKLKNLLVQWVKPPDGPNNSRPILKYAPLSAAQEFMLVLESYYPDRKDEARSAYNKMKDLITVYGDGQININTASAEVLKIISEAAAITQGLATTYADSLVNNRIIPFRNGNDGKMATADDGYFENAGNIENDLRDAGAALTAQEVLVLNGINGMLKVQSNHFKVPAQARAGRVVKNIEAVYARDKIDSANSKIVYWHEN